MKKRKITDEKFKRSTLQYLVDAAKRQCAYGRPTLSGFGAAISACAQPKLRIFFSPCAGSLTSRTGFLSISVPVRGRLAAARRKVKNQSLSSFSTAINASVGTCTVPRLRIFFFPAFCFSSSFFLRVMSPP